MQIKALSLEMKTFFDKQIDKEKDKGTIRKIDNGLYQLVPKGKDLALMRVLPNVVLSLYQQF